MPDCISTCHSVAVGVVKSQHTILKMKCVGNNESVEDVDTLETASVYVQYRSR